MITPEQLMRRDWTEVTPQWAADRLGPDAIEMFVWTGRDEDPAKRTLSAWSSTSVGVYYVLVKDGAENVVQAWRVT